MTRLSTAAERVTDAGIGDTPIMDDRRDEIGTLSRSIRRMTVALQDRVNAVEAFAADVAHEVKNPLTSLQSAIETLNTSQSEDEKKDNVINGLREILSDLFCAITDVSDYYLTMRLSGPKSIEVLTKACPLNFDQYLTKGNSCAQSYISKATVLIDRLSDDLVFDISVRWSFADYLWDWLADSSNEFILSKK